MKYDEIGYWSEVKLEIIKEYAAAYSTILTGQKSPFLYHIYIDAFAGSGLHVSRTSGHYVSGSPLNALVVQPPFKEYHFIDLDKDKVQSLRQVTETYPSVYIYEGDCNSVLLRDVFPRAKYEAYRRALCLLDPYGLHLTWEVIQTAAKMRSVEIFLNFPIADINRNVLRRNPENPVEPANILRMNSFWGDESWKEVAYQPQPNLFGYVDEKISNEQLAEAFRYRLVNVAGFKYVPKPVPMRNSKNAIVYYLFFASQKPVAKEIVNYIFNKYRKRGFR